MRKYPEDVYKADLETNAGWEFAWYVERFTPVFKSVQERGIKSPLEFLGPNLLLDSFRYPFICIVMVCLRQTTYQRTEEYLSIKKIGSPCWFGLR